MDSFSEASTSASQRDIADGSASMVDNENSVWRDDDHSGRKDAMAPQPPSGTQFPSASVSDAGTPLDGTLGNPLLLDDQVSLI